jgi:hypothetical protein
VKAFQAVQPVDVAPEEDGNKHFQHQEAKMAGHKGGSESPSRRQEPARAYARPYLMAIARPMPMSAPVTRTTGDRLIDLAFRRHRYL